MQAGMNRFGREGSVLVFCSIADLIFSATAGPALGWTSHPVLASTAHLLFVRKEQATCDPILELRLSSIRNCFRSNFVQVF